MKINEASDCFKTLVTETGEKSEKRVYEKFLGILSDLKNRGLTEEELQSIEQELDALELKATTENRKKYLKQRLGEFEKYLRVKFSLISGGHHTGIGMVFGMSSGSPFGMVFGLIFGEGTGMVYGMIVGMNFGMILGLMIGALMDSEAKKQNRVLNTKLR